MSLKSILRGIGSWISDRWKALNPWAKKAIAIGVTVTNAIKEFDTNNPGVGDIITRVIPGEWDDALVAKVREKLPEVMIQLKLVEATFGLTDPNEIVHAGILAIQQMAGDYKSGTLNNISIILSRIAADGKLDWDDAVYLAKHFYDAEKDPDIDTTL